MTSLFFSGHPLRRRRFLSLAATAAGAAYLRLPRPVAAQPAGVIRETLPNGMVVIVEERRVADTVAVVINARLGSRDDTALPGLSFVTLLTMFAGTVSRPSTADIQRAIGNVGGTVNGSTVEELSSFFAVVPSNEGDAGFDIVADLVRNPLFDRAVVERQKQADLQRIAAQRADPNSLMALLFQQAMFAGHPAGIPILGTEESVRAMTREDMLANHAVYWNAAANQVLTVVGRIRPEEALARARAFFGDMPAGTANTRPAVAMPVPTEARTVHGAAGTQQLQFRLGFPAPVINDPDWYAFRVLNAITSGGAGRIFREIRSLRGLAYSAGSGYQWFTDAGTWFAGAGIDPENLEMVVDIMRGEVMRLRDELVGQDELEDKIGLFGGQQQVASELNLSRATQLAQQELLGVPTAEELVARIRQVTAVDVQRVARRYLDLERALLVVVGPRGQT